MLFKECCRKLPWDLLNEATFFTLASFENAWSSASTEVSRNFCLLCNFIRLGATRKVLHILIFLGDYFYSFDVTLGVLAAQIIVLVCLNNFTREKFGLYVQFFLRDESIPTSASHASPASSNRENFMNQQKIYHRYRV